MLKAVPRPRPMMSRPLLTWAMSASCSARRIGWWSEVWTTASQFAALGRGRERGREGDGVDVAAIAIDVMLAQPQHLDAELLGAAGLAQRLLHDAPVLIRVAALGKPEIAELRAAIASSLLGLRPSSGFRRKPVHRS